MKIYLFSPETGLYLGEYIAYDALMQSGAFVIPPGATTVAPPEGGRGHTMVYVADAQCWEVHSRW
jgi:hypothetical protein